MKPGITHRLRGHRVTQHVNHISLPGTYLERGVIERVAECSCGETWLLMLTNPLRNRWEWK